MSGRDPCVSRRGNQVGHIGLRFAAKRTVESHVFDGFAATLRIVFRRGRQPTFRPSPFHPLPAGEEAGDDEWDYKIEEVFGAGGGCRRDCHGQREHSATTHPAQMARHLYFRKLSARAAAFALLIEPAHRLPSLESLPNAETPNPAFTKRSYKGCGLENTISAMSRMAPATMALSATLKSGQMCSPI